VEVVTDLGARQAGATHHVQNEIFGDLIATCVCFLKEKASFVQLHGI
jgi:hypothetical protein